MNNNNKQLLIVSCAFGEKFKKVHPAPKSKNCYFFSNNDEIKEDSVAKGWNFIKIDIHLSTDYLESSLQSKYIKFLQFLYDFPKFKEFKQILYFDHKIHMKNADVDKLLDLYIESEQKFNIIIRKHEEERIGIFTEIDDSLQFDEYLQIDRYTRNMDKTIAFVNDNLKKEDIDNIEICNTGLMLYSDYNEIMPLLDEVYNTCIMLQQPQCQIIWSVVSQKYSDKIKKIDFYEVINPDWTEPFLIDDRKNDSMIFYLCIGILFLLFVVCLSFVHFSSFKKFCIENTQLTMLPSYIYTHLTNILNIKRCKNKNKR
jgi:hypothetical protein